MSECQVLDLNSKYVEESIFNIASPGDEFSYDDLDAMISAIGAVTSTIHMIQIECVFDFMGSRLYPTFISVPSIRHGNDLINKWIYTGMCELGQERVKFFVLPFDEMIEGLDDVSKSFNNMSVVQQVHIKASIRILRMYKNYQLSAKLRLR